VLWFFNEGRKLLNKLPMLFLSRYSKTKFIPPKAEIGWQFCTFIAVFVASPK
jgi:hypothetical protein